MIRIIGTAPIKTMPNWRRQESAAGREAWYAGKKSRHASSVDNRKRSNPDSHASAFLRGGHSSQVLCGVLKVSIGRKLACWNCPFCPCRGDGVSVSIPEAVGGKAPVAFPRRPGEDVR